MKTKARQLSKRVTEQVKIASGTSTTHTITIVPTLDKKFLIFKQYNINQSPLDPCWHAVQSPNRVNHRYEEVLQ